ncbi:MAG: hypothetical protein H5U00_12320 [Clostridia bacterium]|nr:hypothetical protein [Clostridia bacterium]
MYGDFEELRRRAQELKQRPGAGLGDLLREYGISPENEAQVRQLLAQAGFVEEDLANARSLVEEMVAGLDRTTRQQLAEVFAQMTAGREDKIPPEVKEFLEQMQRG